MEEKKKAIAKKKDVKYHGVKVSFDEPLEINQSGMSSVEMKRNAKGGTEFNIKVYAPNADDAKKDVAKIYKDLSKEFPTG